MLVHVPEFTHVLLTYVWLETMMCCTMIVLCQVNHSLKNYRERYTILPALNFKLALCLNNVFALLSCALLSFALLSFALLSLSLLGFAWLGVA